MPEPVNLPDHVYELVRAPESLPSGWVRIAVLRRRMRGADGAFVEASTNQVAVWDAASEEVTAGAVKYPARTGYQIHKYFKDEFTYPGWTRVVIVCDVDGANSVSVTADPEGPAESDYLSGFDDPFFDYVSDHRAELVVIARRRCGG